MSLSDPIGDMIARVKNAQARYHKKVELPSSNFKSKIADILKTSKSIFKDFLPKGPSIFKMFPAIATLTFSGIEMFILPIFDIIKKPYKLFRHQLFAF